MRLWLFTLSALLLSLVKSASAEELLLVTEHLPPLHYQDASGNLVGDISENVNQLLDRAGLAAQPRVLPWGRAYDTALHRPNTLIYSLLQTPERKSKFHWIVKLRSLNTFMMTAANRDDLAMASLEEIDDELVGVKRNDVASHFLASRIPKGNLVQQTYTVDTVRMLLNSRIDMIPINKTQLQFHCRELGCNLQQFKILFPLKQMEQDIYLAASLGTDSAILERLREASTDNQAPVKGQRPSP